MRKLMMGVVGVMFALSTLSAQEPTCKNCPGTHVPNAEVQAWFTKIDDHIVYLMVRIDPDKVTPNRSEAGSKAYLNSKPNAR